MQCFEARNALRVIDQSRPRVHAVRPSAGSLCFTCDIARGPVNHFLTLNDCVDPARLFGDLALRLACVAAARFDLANRARNRGCVSRDSRGSARRQKAWQSET